MPSRNTIREYDAPAYYHAYNRGAGGAAIFRDAQDKRKFLSLLARYLDDSDDLYPTYSIKLVAYCVMSNHFHLLLYQDAETAAITALMRSVSTAYSMYYNFKYKNKGHVFQGVFRASRIINEPYLIHISRYIHLNPESYKTYRWSSLPYFVGTNAPAWLHPERVLDMTPTVYRAFLEEYKDRRLLLKEIKELLA
jgi:putative transposase